MKPSTSAIGIILFSLACTSCVPSFDTPPIETSFAFTNFSQKYYAALRIRAHSSTTDPAIWYQTPLLPPGTTYRVRFLDSLGTGCADSLDFQLFLYKRIHDDLPIGIDPGEAVEQTPIVAGQVFHIPACNVQAVETYTIVNWDAPEGTARVKFAQDSPVDTAIRNSGIFPNVDAAWEITGIDAALAGTPPPPHYGDIESIAGKVTLAGGRGVEGIGVLVRTRYRGRLNAADPSNGPDAGCSEPIAYTYTDTNGRFTFDRPPGAYRVEFLSDDYLFRPAIIDVESPLEIIQTIVEPMP